MALLPFKVADLLGRELVDEIAPGGRVIAVGWSWLTLSYRESRLRAATSIWHVFGMPPRF